MKTPTALSMNMFYDMELMHNEMSIPYPPIGLTPLEMSRLATGVILYDQFGRLWLNNSVRGIGHGRYLDRAYLQKKNSNW